MIKITLRGLHSQKHHDSTLCTITISTLQLINGHTDQSIRTYRQLTAHHQLKMTPAQVVETTVTNNNSTSDMP